MLMKLLIKLFENQDKVMHMIEYAGMNWFGLSVFKPLTPAGFVAWGAFSVVFAASDEIHQAFVPGRQTDVMDWLADVAGICISSYIYYYKSLNKIK